MFVSQTAEYALRAMAYLATLPGGEGARAQDVSRHTAIPLPYASKVLRRLAQSGLVIAQKGHGGGFRLARAPARISFRDVFTSVDAEFEKTSCAFGLGECSTRHPCPLHPAVATVRESVATWARRTTLADVIGSARRRKR